jgi:hypothetical protein
MSLAAIAAALNADGVATAQGGRQWWPSTVRAVLRATSLGRSPFPPTRHASASSDRRVGLPRSMCSRPDRQLVVGLLRNTPPYV